MLQEKIIKNGLFDKVVAPDAQFAEWLTLHGETETRPQPKRPGLGLFIVVATCGSFWLLTCLVISSF
jgi:hypothetical protein